MRRHVDQIRPVGDKVKNDCPPPFVYRQIPIERAAESDSVERNTENSVSRVLEERAATEAPVSCMPSQTTESYSPSPSCVRSDGPMINSSAQKVIEKPELTVRRSNRIRKAPKRLDL